jgi:hypothetical protein
MIEEPDPREVRKLSRKLKRQRRWERLGSALGFRGKTLWDLLQLLIIPIVLAGLGFWFNKNETIRQEALALDRQREDAFQSYIDRMENLLIVEKLRTSDADSEARAVAKSRTITVLRGLDGERKGLLLVFLYESGLINVENPIIKLKDADLSNAKLQGTFLRGANLQGVDLENADLRGAILQDADLRRAILTGATLEWAELEGAKLRDLVIDETTVLSHDQMELIREANQD